MSNVVHAAPTKAFFVKMLTRDIELRDAILDLLDNCVDGIVRTKPKGVKGKPYAGFNATITAMPSRFVIEDNCGGIPIKTAKDVAFRLGRPTDAKFEKLETVGLYGIGMKRAIFKLGENAVVTSENNGDRFRVRITKAWLNDDKTWDLPMEVEKPTGKVGTRIEVTDLYPDIQREFGNQANFLTDLNGAVRQLYAMIMNKGFAVRLNKDELEPIAFNILRTESDDEDAAAINPYVLRGKIGAVEVEVVVGFYRKPLSEDELDEENESPKADLSQAGWSVVCNDRLVLRGDKSAVTGWGTANVPRFHNQFSSIAGLVTLRSTDPALLPLNTTKRGIEMSSDVYFRLLDYMREGVKHFTDYTNRWKRRSEEGKAFFQQAKPTLASDIPKLVSPSSYTKVSARRLANGTAEAKIFTPNLPKPPREDADTRRIVFSRPLDDIVLIATELLDDPTAPPSQVGETCFDAQLAKHKKAKR